MVSHETNERRHSRASHQQYQRKLCRIETIRATLNLANCKMARLHPLGPKINMTIRSPTNLHTSPRYAHHTDMPAAAVDFAKLDQQAYHKAQHNGILFLMYSRQHNNSKWILATFLNRPSPRDSRSHHRNHYDGPDLSSSNFASKAHQTTLSLLGPNGWNQQICDM